MREIRTAKGKMRRRGLLGLKEPPEYDLFIHTPVIHTFGMRFPIYLAWTRGGRVVKIQRAKPNRIYCYFATGCLETSNIEGLRPGVCLQK